MSEPIADLENALQGLAPAPAALDRDRLMFLAGQATLRGHGLVWKLTSGMFAAATLVLVLFVALKPEPEPHIVRVFVDRPTAKETPVPKPQEELSPPDSSPGSVTENDLPDLPYYRLQQQVMRFGVEGLPGLSNPGPPSNDPPVTVERLGKMSPTSGGLNFFLWQ